MTPEEEAEVGRILLGVDNFAADMKSQGIHIGMGSKPTICVVDGEMWPCQHVRNDHRGVDKALLTSLAGIGSEAMSARDEYPEAAGPTLHAYVRQHAAMCDEIDRLSAECKAWMNGVADFVERFGFDRDAACGPADLLPGLRSAQDEIDRLRAEVEKWKDRLQRSTRLRFDAALEIKRLMDAGDEGRP